MEGQASLRREPHSEAKPSWAKAHPCSMSSGAGKGRLQSHRCGRPTGRAFCCCSAKSMPWPRLPCVEQVMSARATSRCKISKAQVADFQ